MICPGRHSVFAGFDVAVTPAPEAAGDLRFAVSHADSRFHRVVLAVAGDGILGSVSAFMRAPPVEPASLVSLRSRVRPDEFVGTTSLIVGGSRGLGAVTAKLLACGGGTLIVTHVVGRQDAEAVAAEINQADGRCLVAAYDVRQPATDQVTRLPLTPTHLYYFATPAIFRQKRAVFEAELLREFLAFYVDGFYALCRALLDRSPSPLAVFYPSSVAVEERPRDLTEYAMAKSAGELLCADLPRALAQLSILSRRLPRLATDQTTSLLDIETPPAADVLLPIIRALHASPVSA
jgi:hypothetical protein